MQKLQSGIIIGILMFSMDSCVAPYTISELKPQSKNSYWLWGKEYVRVENQNYKLEIAYLQNNRSQFIFDVYVLNKSKDTLLLDPSLFYSMITTSLENRSQYMAINPKAVLRQLRLDIAQNDAEQTNQTISSLISTSTELAADIATMSEPKNDEHYASREEARLTREDEAYRLQYESMSLNSKKEFFETNMLMKNSLPEGYEVHGQVYFQRSEKFSPVIELFFPLGRDTLTLSFNHQWFYQ